MLQAQSKVHRSVACLPMTVASVRRLELALRPEAEPRVRAVAVQSEQALPSEQWSEPLSAPLAQQPVGAAEAEPLVQREAATAQLSVRALKVAQHEARLAAAVEPGVQQVEAAEQDAQPEVQPLARLAAEAESDVPPVEAAEQVVQPEVQPLAQPAVEAGLDVPQVEEAVQDARRVAAVAQAQPWEARAEQPSVARLWAAPSRLVLRLARL